MRRLENKVAVVTGAAGGIGLASAQRLANEGATVVLADINLAGAQAAAATIEGASAHHVDLTDESAVGDFCASVADQYGGIDILHNNAAIRKRSINHILA